MDWFTVGYERTIASRGQGSIAIPLPLRDRDAKGEFKRDEVPLKNQFPLPLIKGKGDKGG